MTLHVITGIHITTVIYTVSEGLDGDEVEMEEVEVSESVSGRAATRISESNHEVDFILLRAQQIMECV